MQKRNQINARLVTASGLQGASSDIQVYSVNTAQCAYDLLLYSRSKFTAPQDLATSEAIEACVNQDTMVIPNTVATCHDQFGVGDGGFGILYHPPLIYDTCSLLYTLSKLWNYGVACAVVFDAGSAIYVTQLPARIPQITPIENLLVNTNGYYLFRWNTAIETGGSSATTIDFSENNDCAVFTPPFNAGYAGANDNVNLYTGNYGSQSLPHTRSQKWRFHFDAAAYAPARTKAFYEADYFYASPDKTSYDSGGATGWVSANRGDMMQDLEAASVIISGFSRYPFSKTAYIQSAPNITVRYDVAVHYGIKDSGNFGANLLSTLTQSAFDALGEIGGTFDTLGAVYTWDWNWNNLHYDPLDPFQSPPSEPILSSIAFWYQTLGSFTSDSDKHDKMYYLEDAPRTDGGRYFPEDATVYAKPTYSNGMSIDGIPSYFPDSAHGNWDETVGSAIRGGYLEPAAWYDANEAGDAVGNEVSPYPGNSVRYIPSVESLVHNASRVGCKISHAKGYVNVHQQATTTLPSSMVGGAPYGYSSSRTTNQRVESAELISPPYGCKPRCEFSQWLNASDFPKAYEWAVTGGYGFTLVEGTGLGYGTQYTGYGHKPYDVLFDVICTDPMVATYFQYYPPVMGGGGELTKVFDQTASSFGSVSDWVNGSPYTTRYRSNGTFMSDLFFTQSVLDFPGIAKFDSAFWALVLCSPTADNITKAINEYIPYAGIQSTGVPSDPSVSPTGFTITASGTTINVTQTITFGFVFDHVYDPHHTELSFCPPSPTQTLSWTFNFKNYVSFQQYSRGDAAQYWSWIARDVGGHAQVPPLRTDAARDRKDKVNKATGKNKSYATYLPDNATTIPVDIPASIAFDGWDATDDIANLDGAWFAGGRIPSSSPDGDQPRYNYNPSLHLQEDEATLHCVFLRNGQLYHAENRQDGYTLDSDMNPAWTLEKAGTQPDGHVYAYGDAIYHERKIVWIGRAEPLAFDTVTWVDGGDGYKYPQLVVPRQTFGTVTGWFAQVATAQADGTWSWSAPLETNLADGVPSDYDLGGIAIADIAATFKITKSGDNRLRIPFPRPLEDASTPMTPIIAEALGVDADGNIDWVQYA